MPFVVEIGDTADEQLNVQSRSTFTLLPDAQAEAARYAEREGMREVHVNRWEKGGDGGSKQYVRVFRMGE